MKRQFMWRSAAVLGFVLAIGGTVWANGEGFFAPADAGPVEVVKVPGINHLLVPATTGEPEEYASLPDKHVSQAIIAPVVAWLQKTLAAPAR